MWSQGKINVIWDDQYKNLIYRKEIFNNPLDVERWRQVGYNQEIEQFSGLMCPHGENHPEWTSQIIEYFQDTLGLNDLGICFYKMETGIILPVHGDHYHTYMKRFNVSLEKIHRVLVFLEDWKSGHYFEVDGVPIFNYKAGTFASWNGDTKHMAANIGEEDRYTLQITGWK